MGQNERQGLPYSFFGEPRQSPRLRTDPGQAWRRRGCRQPETRGGPDGEGVRVGSIERSMFRGPPRLRRLSTNAATVPWTSRSGPVRRCRSVDVFRGGSQCAGQSVRGATQRDLRPQRGPAVGTHSVCAGQTAQMVRTTTSVLRRGRQVATAGGIPNARTAPSTSLAGVTTGDVRVAARSTTRRLYGAGPLSHRQPPRLGGCAAPLKLLP